MYVYVQKFYNLMPEYYVCGFIVSEGSLLKIFPSNSNLYLHTSYIATYSPRYYYIKSTQISRCYRTGDRCVKYWWRICQ